MCAHLLSVLLTATISARGVLFRSGLGCSASSVQHSSLLHVGQSSIVEGFVPIVSIVVPFLA